MTTNTKHTPGPWQWDDDEVWQEGYDTEQHAPWLVGPAGERILTGQIHCLSKRDARLIAAAPELLEALNEINNWLVCGCIASPEDMAQSFPCMSEIANAALTKAGVL